MNGRINVYVMLFEAAQPDHAFGSLVKSFFVGYQAEGGSLTLSKQSANMWRLAIKLLGLKRPYPNYIIRNEIALKHPFRFI
jgi:hypothetical protein